MRTPTARTTISTDLQRLYDAYYIDADDAWRRLCARFKADNIIEVCSEVGHGSVLDIGAGNGAVVRELLSRGFCAEATCVDVSTSAVARILESRIPGLIEAQTFDGYTLPYHDKQFDLAIASHVLEHVEHERVFLREALRVARYLFVEVPLEDTIRLNSDYIEDKVGHINYYNWKTIRRLPQTCGAQVLKQYLYNTPYEVHAYMAGKVKGAVRFGIRAVADRLGQRAASRVFVYHCGLLLKDGAVAAC